MILFVVDIFYLQFIIRFETNLTSSLKKSRYSTFIFLKKITFCSNFAKRNLSITIFFYFSEQLAFHCALRTYLSCCLYFRIGILLE